MQIHQIPGSRIARGAFGEISLALATSQHEQSNASDDIEQPTTTSLSIVALKTVFVEESSADTRTNTDETALLDEITCLRELHPHPNIVPLWKVLDNAGDAPGFKSLVLPYCPMDLYSVLEWKRLSFHPPLSMAAIHCLASHLFRALQHVHEHNIVHGDIRPSNLLLNGSTGQLQLADFGISQRDRLLADKEPPVHTDDQQMAVEPDPEDMAAQWALKLQQQSQTAKQKKPTAISTLQYRPPELLLGSQSAEPALDMFSAGVTVAGIADLSGNQRLVPVIFLFSSFGNTSFRKPTPSITGLGQVDFY